MLAVTAVEHIGDYRLRLAFSDGAKGVVDLESALWGPVFEPLKDPARFRQFELSPAMHTICWGDQADFAPEFLRERLTTDANAAT